MFTHCRMMLRVLVATLAAVPVALAAQLPAAQGKIAPTEPAPMMQAGDILRMKVFREVELSGDFQVSERGTVTLPRLGELPVGQWAPDSVAPRLTRAFAEYLRDPTVEVTILRRIAVTGSVQRPNIYPVDGTMSVYDALALAGGASPDGVRDRVELRRGNERIVANLNQQAFVSGLRLRSGDQLYVPERSWISRNTWLLSSLIGATMTFTTIMLTR